MFKIGKLEKVKNEELTIDVVAGTRGYFDKEKKKSIWEEYKTLSFDISGDNYSFGFELNCELEKLLEIPMEKTIDFKDYIFPGETWLNIKDLNGIEPEMDISIIRYLNNKFLITIYFYTEYSYDGDTYSGMIEIDFNLDNYLNI